MFLSKILVNIASPRARVDLGNRDSMHRTIMKLFPRTGDDQRAREALGVLFRVEEKRDGISILVQSRLEPDWRYLPRDYAMIEPASKNINALIDRIRTGLPVRFRIQASPVIKHGRGTTRPDGTTGNWTESIRDDDGQVEWMKRKATASGMNVVSVNTTGKGHARFSRRDTGDGGYYSVTFDGIAFITDPMAFTRAIEKGIGSGKAFGMGMLSFAPVA